MSQASLSGSACDLGVGAVCFTTDPEAPALEADSEADGWLVVRPELPPPASRGRLASLLEEAVERGLAGRHAAPPGIGASGNLDGSLSDQLYRARTCGARGLCLCVPSLRTIAGAGGALDVEDSAVLRWWMAATAERPVRFVLDSDNLSLGVYGPPMALRTLLDAGADVWRAAAVHQDAPTESAAPAPAHSDSLPDPIDVAPLFPDATQNWPAWVNELDSAHGPKPLSVVERQFLSAYLPLSEAVARGIAGAEARSALDAWAQSFAKSYTDAFDALRVRTKRPTMVLDAPELALRIARLHGARSVQLVLVDAMRFDLGLRIRNRVSARVAHRAMLSDQLLLWAALPTTTSVQLELVGRGSDGLRDQGSTDEAEVTLARGRNAATLRRVKAGSRELLKLDTVESRLADPGGPLLERLDALAESTAEALASHLLRLADRTLVLVFGDHGFLCDEVDQGTGPGRHGGARPEEVLVPAFAWLVGSAE